MEACFQELDFIRESWDSSGAFTVSWYDSGMEAVPPISACVKFSHTVVVLYGTNPT